LNLIRKSKIINNKGKKQKKSGEDICEANMGLARAAGPAQQRRTRQAAT
jgi:hypothetical protein